MYVRTLVTTPLHLVSDYFTCLYIATRAIVARRASDQTEKTITPHFIPPHSPMSGNSNPVAAEAPAVHNPTQTQMQTNAGIINNTRGEQQGEEKESLEAMVRRIRDETRQEMQAQFDQQREQQQQQFEQRIQQLTQATKKNAAYTAKLSTTPHRSSIPSASATMQRPPVRRQPGGNPTPTAALLSPNTPSAARAVMNDILESVHESDSDSDEDDDHAHSGQHKSTRSAQQQPTLPVVSKEMREVRKSFVSTVKPYDGKTTTDFQNVLEWVEKVDTEFSVLMGEVEEGRIELVRSRLQGSALVWMNREIVQRERMGLATEWNDLRQPFIDAHLGVNTIETFKGELRALRWGEAPTVTLPELNKRFDHLAELVYPNSRWEDSMQAVLGDEYKRIIAASKLWVYKSVAFNQCPTRLEDWKRCVSDRWAAESDVERMVAQLPRGRVDSTSRGRGGERGASAWQSRGGSVATPLNAVGADTTPEDTMQGEPHTVEGEDDKQQLGSVSSSSNRGSRGGRGGRGRGGGGSRQPMSAEKQKLYDERKCFRCHKPGHTVAGCPVPPTPRTQQSNE